MSAGFISMPKLEVRVNKRERVGERCVHVSVRVCRNEKCFLNGLNSDENNFMIFKLNYNRSASVCRTQQGYNMRLF